jgi:hypothetical protein
MTYAKFPIVDIQFHTEGMGEFRESLVNKARPLTAEERVLVCWHNTAISYLKYGAAKGIDGPAAELVVDGQVTTVAIQDELIPNEQWEKGQNYFGFKVRETGAETRHEPYDDPDLALIEFDPPYEATK